MSNEPKNLNEMSDDDFLKLSEEDAIAASNTQTPPQEQETTDETTKEPEQVSEVDDNVQPDPVDGNDPNVADGPDTPEPKTQEGEGEDPQEPAKQEEPVDDPAKKEEGEPKDPDPAKQEEGKAKEPKTTVKLPEGVTVDQASEFFNKLTAPFKAAGKDFTIRSAEDAIRLMQQGVDYSRRMEQLAPVKKLNRLLQDHDLADENKISFLIDVSKGDKSAITKLLKDHKLDPMDLDVSADTSYQGKSYAVDTKDNNFRDALENTVTKPEGKALVREMHAEWDEASKQQIHDNPQFLDDLVQMRESGVYAKIVDEITYQKSMGYLLQTPFLQAYDAVGVALKKAGQLGSNTAPKTNEPNLGNLQPQSQTQVPVDSGARKVVSQRNALPNPQQLTTVPVSKAKSTQTPAPNFDKMSDEEFLKLNAP